MSPCSSQMPCISLRWVASCRLSSGSSASISNGGDVVRVIVCNRWSRDTRPTERSVGAPSFLTRSAILGRAENLIGFLAKWKVTIAEVGSQHVPVEILGTVARTCRLATYSRLWKSCAGHQLPGPLGHRAAKNAADSSCPSRISAIISPDNASGRLSIGRSARPEQAYCKAVNYAVRWAVNLVGIRRDFSKLVTVFCRESEARYQGGLTARDGRPMLLGPVGFQRPGAASESATDGTEQPC